METGQDRLDAKDISHARAYFELASDVDPDSVWALRQVAVARALSDDRKGALDSLRRAKEKSKDPASFSAWLKEEPAFSPPKPPPHNKVTAWSHSAVSVHPTPIPAPPPLAGGLFRSTHLGVAPSFGCFGGGLVPVPIMILGS